MTRLHALCLGGLAGLALGLVLVVGGRLAGLPALTSTPTPAVPGPIDIGFAQSMMLHHQQAIGMAMLILDASPPSPLATLARQIATAQLVELGEMRGWLRLWDAPWVAERPGMDWMRLGRTPPDAALLQYLLDCQQTPTGMVGLATPEAVDRLRQLEGRERDAHFLRLMQAHHEGGLPMARFAATEAKVPVVRELAARIVLEQSEELYRIQRTLLAIAATHAEAASMPSDIVATDQE